MVAALILGAVMAIVLFAVRLLLPASVGARYDRGVLSLFRWIGVASILTVVIIGLYAMVAS